MALVTQKMEVSGEDGMKQVANQKVAVIILNWNGEKLLREFLPKVIATTDRQLCRVIVADNGSTDGSLDLLHHDYFDSVEVITFPENYGFAEGYNKAVALCRSYPYVVLLNSDLATSDGWDKSMYDFMESHPEVGACQPKLLSYKHPDMFEYAGACGGFLDRDGYPFCRGRIFSTCEKDTGQYDSEMEVFWATGACLMVRTGVYLKCGGLDAAFFAHMEEIDLCWRIHTAGYNVAVVPSARVYHLGGGSLPAENPRKTYLNFRNNLLMLHKNLPWSERRGALLRRRLLDTIAWAKYVATFDFANARAIFKAHRDFAKMRTAYTEHPAVNQLRHEGYSKKSILWEYYIRGHKHFSEI